MTIDPSDPSQQFTYRGARYHAEAHGEYPGAMWLVKAVPGQTLADFYGPDAEQVARAFADMMNRRCYDCGASTPGGHIDTCPAYLALPRFTPDGDLLRCPSCHHASEAALVGLRDEHFTYVGPTVDGGFEFTYSYGNEESPPDHIVCGRCGYESPAALYDVVIG